MPLNGYGVLVGHAVDRRREGAAGTPHYQIRVAAEATAHRVAVNAKSQQAPSDLLYLVDDDFRHPVTAALVGLDPGWHQLSRAPSGPNLDFIRGNLFDPAAMRSLPPDVAGPDNDLADLLDHYVQRAIADPDARLYAFGQAWGPEQSADKVFGFRPGAGVHDIHMNQGNSGRFRADDGVWQDGGLLIRFSTDFRWVAIFLAFRSQAWHTDDVTGHTIGGTPPRPDSSDSAIRILAAMVNPVGPAPEEEMVLLLNASPAAVDLTGWRLVDAHRNKTALPAGPLAAGDTMTVRVANGMQLGNQGGSITLLDEDGLKVAGVSYTAEQGRREGWTVVF